VVAVAARERVAKDRREHLLDRERQRLGSA